MDRHPARSPDVAVRDAALLAGGNGGAVAGACRHGQGESGGIVLHDGERQAVVAPGSGQRDGPIRGLGRDALVLRVRDGQVHVGVADFGGAVRCRTVHVHARIRPVAELPSPGADDADLRNEVHRVRIPCVALGAVIQGGHADFEADNVKLAGRVSA